MEWRFSNNSLDLETLREFFKREGSAIIYRKGDQLEREGDAARYYVSGICFTRLQQRHIIHQVVLVQENVGSLTTSPTFGDCLLSKTLNQIQCFLLKFIEFGATVCHGYFSTSSADSDTFAVDAGRYPLVQRYNRTGEPVEQVLQMARITGIVFGCENPKRIGLADGLGDTGHSSGLRLLAVLIQHR